MESRSRANWDLRIGWPAAWLKRVGAVQCVIDIDERTADDLETLEPATVMTGDAFPVWMITKLQRRGFWLLGSLDDDLWKLPEWNPVKRHLPEDDIRRIEEYLRALDALAVTTARLAEVVAPFNPRVYMIPNAVHVASLPLARRNRSQKIRIGWAGSPTHHGDLDAVRAPLEHLLRRRDVRVVILTAGAPFWLARHPRVEVHPAVPYARYYGMLADLQLDLAIAPLAPHEFNESKSSVKAVDYAAAGLPMVASEVGPYRGLPHGETCLLVKDNDPEAWLDAINALIEAPERRRAMGAAARRWAERTHSLDVTGPLWAEALGVSIPERALEAS